MADGNGTGALRTLERNRFFYGKLMDERHFRMEQRYGVDARALLARLGLGQGVLCGLDVSLADGGVWVEPGVALDARGRQVVVPRRVCVAHPEQPTDCRGRPDGDPIETGEVTLSLCYHECETEPVPALVCDCDTHEACVPSVVQERYRLAVAAGIPESGPGLPDGTCAAIFPERPEEGFRRRRAAFDALTGPCPPRHDDCVVLATIRFSPGSPPVVDPFTHRRMIYSNETLFELILCLAARVDACCGGPLPPTLEPPRIASFWPAHGTLLSDQDVMDLRRTGVIEVTFDQRISPASLAASDEWLRLVRVMRRQNDVRVDRIELSYDGPVAQPRVPAAPGHFPEGFAVTLRNDPRARTRYLLQVRSDPASDGIVADAGSPALALDADFPGTNLSDAQLDKLGAVDIAAPLIGELAIWHALVDSGRAALPTGDGTEGGWLDATFSYAPPPGGPHLLAFWPPGGAYLHSAGTADEQAWKASFQEVPRLEVTFERPLDEARLSEVDNWARLWVLLSDGAGGRVAYRLRLTYDGQTGNPIYGAQPPGAITVVLRVELPVGELSPTSRNDFVLQMRFQGAYLPDVDPPNRLVDGDFNGTGLHQDLLDALWSDSDASRITGLECATSLGVELWNDEEGGAVDACFGFAEDA